MVFLINIVKFLILQSALSRLYTFITTSVYETNVGGRFAANLCRAAAKVKKTTLLKCLHMMIAKKKAEIT